MFDWMTYSWIVEVQNICDWEVYGVYKTLEHAERIAKGLSGAGMTVRLREKE